MPVIHHGTTPETEMRSGIRGKFLADGRLGATGVALLLNTAEPGASVPPHMHCAEELVMMFEGRILGPDRR